MEGEKKKRILLHDAMQFIVAFPSFGTLQMCELQLPELSVMPHLDGKFWEKLFSFDKWWAPGKTHV